MDTLNQIFSWLSEHEAGFSALAALVVIVGVVLSPLGAGFRALLSGKQKSRSAAADTAQTELPDVAKDSTAGTRDFLDTPPSIITDKPSIAVLPFVNMSDDKDKEFFADGMTEDIITGLSCDSRLFVIARNSTFAYKGQSPDIRQVGKELGVRYVVEGSVRPVGKHLRITVQLIEAESGNHVWADKIDRPTAEIFEVMDTVVNDLVTALTSNLGVAESKRAKRQRPENLDAWALCVRAEVMLLSQMDSQAIAAAEELAQQAADIEPDYAVSWALLGLLIGFKIVYVPRDNLAKDSEQTFSLISKALRLAPNDPVVLSYCGFAATFAGNAVIAIDYLERSLSINPNSSFSQFVYGAAFLFSGRLEESIAQSQFFIDRFPKDPYISLAYYYLGCAYLTANDAQSAEEALRKCVKHAPDYPWGHLILAMTLQAQGREEDVQQLMRVVYKLEPDWTLELIREIFSYVFVRPEDANIWITLIHEAWQKPSP